MLEKVEFHTVSVAPNVLKQCAPQTAEKYDIE